MRALCKGKSLINSLVLKSYCPLPFRYAPVTVGSGRVELTCET